MSKIGSIYVPSEGDPESKIWLIGEAPGWDEECERRPFIGESGKLLNGVLGRAGISRDSTFITNLCHYKPHGNLFENLKDSWELAEGIAELEGLLASHKPNIIIALGGAPLHYLCNKDGITKYRGSILQSDKFQLKVIATFHPAFILRKGPAYPIFDADIRKAAHESEYPHVIEPTAEFHLANTPDSIEKWRDFLVKQPILACDIETIKETTELLCIGFASSKHHAVCFPYNPFDLNFRNAISDILGSDSVKIFHNGNFDVGVLNINGFKVNRYTEDTLLQAHVLEPELPRDLGFLASMYTRWPYYKAEGRGDIPADVKAWSKKVNKESLYIYNMKDCVVTFEAWQEMNKDMNVEAIRVYKYEMAMQQVALDMTMAGMLRDHARVSLFKHHLDKRKDKLEQDLCNLAKEPVNAGSSKQVCKLLYQTFKLPERISRETHNQTSDEDALISLVTHCTGKVNELKTDKARMEWRIKLGVLKIILELRGINKLLSSYINVTEYDGRIRSFYKVGGTETGRWSAGLFFDGSGLNAQTIPREKLEIDVQPQNT